MLWAYAHLARVPMTPELARPRGAALVVGLPPVTGDLGRVRLWLRTSLTDGGAGRAVSSLSSGLGARPRWAGSGVRACPPSAVLPRTAPAPAARAAGKGRRRAPSRWRCVPGWPAWPAGGIRG